jgi:hypothetical protein
VMVKRPQSIEPHLVISYSQIDNPFCQQHMTIGYPSLPWSIGTAFAHGRPSEGSITATGPERRTIGRFLRDPLPSEIHSIKSINRQKVLGSSLFIML